MDIRGQLFNRMLRYRSQLNLMWGSTVKLYCGINKIKLGKRVKFHGRPILERYPYSQITIGNNARFRSDFTTVLGSKSKTIIRTKERGAKIIIGNNSGFNAAAITACASITIGNNVLMGFNSRIIDFDGHSSYDITKPGEMSPVEIQDKVFIGMNTVILKGVTIGENSVIGANSLVTKDIPPNVIAAGNPCKIIRHK